MAVVKALAEELVNLTVKDVQELINVLKETYGIEPAAAAVVVADNGGAQAGPAEQTEFDVSSSQPAQLNLALSRSLRKLSDLVLRKLRNLLTRLLLLSKRKYPTQRLSSSRLLSKRLALKLRLSNFAPFPA